MLEKGFSVPDLLQPALPAPPSWFPLPVGWSVLGALLLLALLIFSLFRLARWRRNRWRREARAALQHDWPVDDWLTLVKRILLVHRPRKNVSEEFSPQALLATIPVDDDLRRLLCEKYCRADNTLDAGQTQRLRSQLRRWLEALPNV